MIKNFLYVNIIDLSAGSFLNYSLINNATGIIK